MKNIEELHCQACGETSYEFVGGPEREGYSECCNERVVYTQGPNVWGQKTTCESNEDCSHE